MRLFLNSLHVIAEIQSLKHCSWSGWSGEVSSISKYLAPGYRGAGWGSGFLDMAQGSGRAGGFSLGILMTLPFCRQPGPFDDFFFSYPSSGWGSHTLQLYFWNALTIKSLSLSLCSACLVAQLVKNLCRAGDSSLIPGSGISPGEGKGSPHWFLAWKISQTEEPDRL